MFIFGLPAELILGVALVVFLATALGSLIVWATHVPKSVQAERTHHSLHFDCPKGDDCTQEDVTCYGYGKAKRLATV